MDRSEFERLRDMRGKRIVGDIRLERRSDNSVAWEARDIPIINADGVEARLNVQLVAETGAKTLNVKIPGIGPICRLEVDSRPTNRQAEAINTLCINRIVLART
ncbi:MAG: hypothetical protein ACLGJC_03565 [Alphaproteobacteria bacterium]